MVVPTAGLAALWYRNENTFADSTLNQMLYLNNPTPPYVAFRLIQMSGGLTAGWTDYEVGSGSLAALGAGGWNHFACSWAGGGTVRAYVNGAQVATRSAVGLTVPTTSLQVMVGGGVYGSDAAFAGVRIYAGDRDWSGEVRRLANVRTLRDRRGVLRETWAWGKRPPPYAGHRAEPRFARGRREDSDLVRAEPDQAGGRRK